MSGTPFLIAGNMRTTLTQLQKFIATAVILLLMCISIAIVILLVQRFSAEREIVQQIADIDSYFMADRSPVPVSSTTETLLPEKVGNFQRGELYHPSENVKIRCFNPYFQNTPDCFLTTYKNDNLLNQFNRSEIVWVEVWKKDTQTFQELHGIAGTFPCGAELGGILILRSESKTPYAYHECSGFLLASPYLVGIVWENNDWFISVEGNYEAFSQFIAAYPY